MNLLASRYQDRLNNPPTPKEGRHQALLGTASLGILSGLRPEQIHDNFRRTAGWVGISDREIQEAIHKADADHGANGTYCPPPKPSPFVRDGKAALRQIIQTGPFSDDVDLWECSKIRLYDDPSKDSALLLQNLFPPEDWLFMGERYAEGIVGQTIRRVSEWLEFLGNGGKAGPLIIINPLSGKPAPKKSGDGNTYRGDQNVKAYRHCLVEFDNLSREDQIRFWSAARLPIRALIDTGGKSIHAWLDVQKLAPISTAEEWEQRIKRRLYDSALKCLGVDSACSNPARLSRLPGVLRPETGKIQRLLWLSKEGRCVC